MILAWLALAGCAAPTPTSVLLVTLDTTRADALGAYGRLPSPTPHVDALAARGLVIEEVLAAAPLTLPAHASMLTGLDPDVHGVRDNLGYALPPGPETVAGRFQAAGWATGAFVGAVVLDARFGLDRGFDVYEDGFDLTATSGALGVAHHPGDVVAARAIAWLEARGEGPFFAWVHLYDPHRPWTAPEPYASAWADPYLAEVAFADAQVGALVAALEAAGRLEHTAIAVVADHGEGLGEHGELTHGQLAYRSTMRVPAVLAGPGVPRGRADRVGASIDVAATLPALAGLAPVGGGADLRALPADRVVYGETEFPRLHLGLHALRVAQDDRWRLVSGARDERFAWREDPGEQADLGVADAEGARLRAWLAARSSHEAPAAVAPGVRAALEQLGYLAGEPTPAGSDLPDPRDAPDMATLLEQTVIAARTRPPAEGAAVLEAFLAAHPSVTAARQLLATAWERAGEPERALAALDPLLAARPEDPSLVARRGELLLAAGRAEEAEAALRAAVAASPGAVAPIAVLAELLRRGGRCAEVEALAGPALATEPAARLLLVRGACRREGGALVAAVADLEQAAALDPASVDVHYVLGLALAELGRPAEAAVALGRQAARTPDRPAVHAALGAAHYAAGAWHAALDPLARAAALDPADAESRLLLADATLRAGGAPERALALLDEAAALAPTDRRVLEIRAAALLAAGDVGGAVRAMEAAGR